jgi:hypothetical protein
MFTVSSLLPITTGTHNFSEHGLVRLTKLPLAHEAWLGRPENGPGNRLFLVSC